MKDIKLKIGFGYERKFKDIFNEDKVTKYIIIGQKYGNRNTIASYSSSWNKPEYVLEEVTYQLLLIFVDGTVGFDWAKGKDLLRALTEDFKFLPEYREYKILNSDELKSLIETYDSL